MTLLLSPLFTHIFATATAACGKPQLFGILVPWYQYLTLVRDSTTNACDVANFTLLGGNGTNSSLLLIGFAIIDDLIRIAALVAVGYVIYGGIQYVTSEGSPDKTSKAQQTVFNALIGLVVAVLAASIVTFIGNSLA